MATIVAVHGTFAHAESPPLPDGSTAPVDPQWWQGGSSFEHDMRELIDAAPGAGSGKLEVTRFEWSGDNSEVGRREAGQQLYSRLKQLEVQGEPYCVVGHSHGGSVVGWALLESAERKEPLKGLKRWITVGTPFVGLKKERLLFNRLNLMQKVIFVASGMLLLMWLVYLLAQWLSGERWLFGNTFPGVLVVTGVMMSLPALVFYFVLKHWDRLSLVHYRQTVKDRAAKFFAPRWMSLTHTDDEAVQGLAFLPGAKLYFFDKAFAVSAITTLSVVAVPLIYLFTLTSPTLMVGLADALKTHVYDDPKNLDAEKALRSAAEHMRTMRNAPGAQTTDRSRFWAEYGAIRRDLQARYANLPAADRALRFKRRFFEHDGKPCNVEYRLCGEGRQLRVNSALLLHLVTDEISNALGGEGTYSWAPRFFLQLMIPALLVPIIFGALALGLMYVIRFIAQLVSEAASGILNNITNNEVKRAAFGNDTEGEVALGAVDRPSWVERSPPRLPAALGDLVTIYSNGVAGNSLAKFRRAIGQLASAEPKHTADSAITTYFTWKELVHASYFDVPEFRKLVAQAISRSEGFAPSGRFQSDPDFARTAQWLAEIEGTPGTRAMPSSVPPDRDDAGAVAAVVASTVKAHP